MCELALNLKFLVALKQNHLGQRNGRVSCAGIHKAEKIKILLGRISQKRVYLQYLEELQVLFCL
jgi:hypothetical protein